MEHLGEILYCLVVAATLTVECLVIVWSVTSRRPRLLRAFVVWAGVALLLPARAYVPALVLTMTAALTWVLTYALDNWPGGAAEESRGKASAWNFHIADLFVLTLLVGTVATIYRVWPLSGYWSIFILPVLGLPLGPVLAFASRIGTGPYRARMAAATTVAIAISALMLVWSGILQSLPLIRMQMDGTIRRESIAVHVALVACLASCAGLAAWLSLKLWTRPPQRWRRWGYSLTLALTVAFAALVTARYVDELLLRQVSEIGSELIWVALHAAPVVVLAMLSAAMGWLLRRDWSRSSPVLKHSLRIAAATSAILLLLPTGWLYWQMVRPIQFLPPPASPQNHYDRIIAITQELGERHNVWGRGRGRSAANDPLLHEALILLRQNNFVTTAALEEETKQVYPRRVRADYLHDFTTHLCIAARAEADRGNYDQAADYCLAGVQFGEMFQNGGTTGLRRFGSLRQFEALSWLAQHSKQLSAGKAQEISTAIGKAFQGREDPAAAEQRELVSWDRTQGWHARLRTVLPKSPLALEHEAALWLDRRDADAQLVSVQTILAIRAFEEAEHQLPAALADLLPQFLSQLPQDPHSGNPLIYRPTTTDFELYSVGRDGIDNGGTFDPSRYGEPGFDLDLSWKDGGGGR